MTTVLYPGSFDPVHYGHLDVIRRAAAVFERVVVGVARETHKAAPLFDVEVRVRLLQEAVAALVAAEPALRRVEVRAYEGLTVEAARAAGATLLVKGLRGVEDVEHELRQAVMNRHLAGLDTVFFMTTPAYAQISSTLIREVARLGGDVSAFVPPAVASALAAARR
mgnify:CR=1 FL=1